MNQVRHPMFGAGLRWWQVSAALLMLSGACQLSAVEIKGRVESVRGNVALVVTDGDLVPAMGDRAAFLSGSGATVATGKATGRKETTITVQIENGVGAVVKDQRVRFASGADANREEVDVPNTFLEAQSVIEARERKAASDSTPRPLPAVAAKNGFAGLWKVQSESQSYILHLRQMDGRVTGTYGVHGGSLAGVIRDGLLQANWKQPGNRRGGSVALRLSADGNTLSGRWEYSPAIFSSGLKGSGTWTFRRVNK